MPMGGLSTRSISVTAGCSVAARFGALMRKREYPRRFAQKACRLRNLPPVTHIFDAYDRHDCINGHACFVNEEQQPDGESCTSGTWAGRAACHCRKRGSYPQIGIAEETQPIPRAQPYARGSTTSRIAFLMLSLVILLSAQNAKTIITKDNHISFPNRN